MFPKQVVIPVTTIYLITLWLVNSLLYDEPLILMEELLMEYNSGGVWSMIVMEYGVWILMEYGVWSMEYKYRT